MIARSPALLLTLFALPAWAQGTGGLRPHAADDGRLLLAGPAVTGSARESPWSLLRSFDDGRIGGPGAESGIGYALIDTPQTRIGLRVAPRPGRERLDAPVPRATGDTDAGLEASLYWNRWLTPAWTVGVNLRGGNHGGELDLGTRRNFVIASGTRMSLFGLATASSERSNRPAHGVDGGAFAASGPSGTTPGSGLRVLQLGASVNHELGGRWIAIGGLGVGWRLGDAFDSPLLRDRTQVSGFAAIGYRLY